MTYIRVKGVVFGLLSFLHVKHLVCATHVPRNMSVQLKVIQTHLVIFDLEPQEVTSSLLQGH